MLQSDDAVLSDVQNFLNIIEWMVKFNDLVINLIILFEILLFYINKSLNYKCVAELCSIRVDLCHYAQWNT